MEPSLSQRDKEILKFAVNSGASGQGRVTIEQIADGTGCTVDYIYKRLSNLEFRSLFFETLRSCLAVEIPAILEKFVEAARDGSYRHGKLVLEIAGLYNAETNVNLKADVGVRESPFKSDKDRKRFLEETLKDFIDTSALSGDSDDTDD